VEAEAGPRAARDAGDDAGVTAVIGAA